MKKLSADVLTKIDKTVQFTLRKLMMLQEPKPFDYLIFIGRFQPFHVAHQEVLDIAFSLSKNVILILGSAQNERTIKNPFNVQERQQMICSTLSPALQSCLFFVPIIDLYNDEKWTAAVKEGVNAILPQHKKVGLIGHFKDESSYYLRLFPEWQLLELDNLQNQLSATPLREQYYQGNVVEGVFHQEVEKFLLTFKQTQAYDKLKHHYLAKDNGVIE